MAQLDLNNETIRLIHSHRSIRKFKPSPLADETVAALVEAAQRASTSSFTQSYSVIHVKDPALREELARLAGDQDYVAESGAFLVWCADMHRNQLACRAQGVSIETQGLEPFLVATVDTALAAQTALLAAESMGLGGVFIGGIRNQPEEVARLLELPEMVYPVFGMCLGHPDQVPLLRPRLPLSAVLHEDKYKAGDLPRLLEAYDATVTDYYRRRSEGAVADAWTALMARHFTRPRRPGLKRFIESQGFRLT